MKAKFRWEDLMTSRVRGKKGLVLLELIIIVLIVVILAAIAIPAYQNYIAKSRVEPPTSDVPDRVDKALKTMKWGNIAFNNPKVLGYGTSAVVQLLLSGSKTGNQLLSIVSEEGQKETYEVQFTNDMEAHLRGVAFEITAVTPERQAVSSAGVAEWKWEIRAKQLGEQKLFLALNANLLIDNRERKHTVQTFSKTLHINVVWPQSVLYFLWSYWQWICTAIAIPLVGWVGSRIFGKKNAKAS